MTVVFDDESRSQTWLTVMSSLGGVWVMWLEWSLYDAAKLPVVFIVKFMFKLYKQIITKKMNNMGKYKSARLVLSIYQTAFLLHGFINQPIVSKMIPHPATHLERPVICKNINADLMDSGQMQTTQIRTLAIHHL